MFFFFSFLFPVCEVFVSLSVGRVAGFAVLPWVAIGRSWNASDLRKKTMDELHQIWYVLQKEKCALLTEKDWCRTERKPFPEPSRLHKV